VAQTIFRRLLDLIARIVPAGTFLTNWILYWSFTAGIRVETEIVLNSAALKFLDNGAWILVKNTEPVRLINDNPGEWVEERVGANATQYEVADDFRDAHATSVKSNHQNQTRLLRAITQEALTLEGKHTFQPRNTAPASTPPRTGIKTQALMVAIPENHTNFFKDWIFKDAVRRVAEDTEVVIRVIPIRGWRTG
jgi:hypothetical protein